MRRAQRNKDAMLAALADASMPETERGRVLEQVESQPQLARELSSQRDALAALEPLRAAEAPRELHSAINSMLADAAPGKRARRPAMRLVPVGAVVTAAIVVAALLVGSSGSSAPTVRQAALLGLRPATLPSPAESHHRSGTLVASVDGIPFPYWEHVLGWKTNGSRTDTISGQTATTVFYKPGAPATGMQRVGYTIMAGRALAVPNAPTITQRGIHFRVLSDNGATVLTWRRNGHTCILAARGVSAATLARLASWT